jgi:hypothetical protein
MKAKPVSFPLNSIVGIAFLVLGLLAIVQKTWVDVGIWSALGLAFLVIGADEQPWAAKPLWRRISAVVFLLIGLAAVVARVVIDFRR